MKFFSKLLLLAGIGFLALPELATAGIHEWQLNFQPAASVVQEDVADMHNFLLIIITAITIFVLGLLAYTCIRFSAKNNPTPKKFTHNTTIEIVWTAIPVLILMVIAVPSFKLLYSQDVMPEADMTIKVVGYQWYWGYEYPDHGGIAFDSYLKKTDVGDPLRLLHVDNEVVLPVEKNIRIQVTAADVLHSWAVPAFGVKKDAMPGRLNETWVRITKPGKYYGQCSELCGVYHGFMPIVIRAVPQEEFDAWVEKAKEQFAEVRPESERVEYMAQLDDMAKATVNTITN